MLEVFKILKGFEGIRDRSFFRVLCTRTRGYSLKLYKERVNKEVLKSSFGNRVNDQWNNIHHLIGIIGIKTSDYRTSGLSNFWKISLLHIR
jgi:hypothetical protein